MSEPLDPSFDPAATTAAKQVQVAYWVRVIGYLLHRRVIVGYAPWKLRSGAFTVMVMIGEHPGIAQTDVARETGLDTSSIVGIVDELEQRGLAVRSRSTKDRRRNLLHLTDEGRRTVKAMFEAAAFAEDPLRREFSEDELALFLDFLRRAHSRLALEDRNVPDQPDEDASA